MVGVLGKYEVMKGGGGGGNIISYEIYFKFIIRFVLVKFFKMVCKF